MGNFYIYGLIDPLNHLVRYVGLTTQEPALRYRQHCGGFVPATAEWVASLPVPPSFVLLEEGLSKRVAVGSKGVRRVRAVSFSAAVVAETKWIKRFRRTVLNRKMRDNCAAAWDSLTNK